MKRVALLSPTLRPGSMAAVLTERLSTGYPREGNWHRPAFEVASGQDPAAAGSADGVIIVGEADALTGRPADRVAAAAFIEACFAVLEKAERRVPVFAGPGLFTAKHLVATAARLKLPFMSSTPLPLTWRLPATVIPRADEALLVAPAELPDPASVEALLAVTGDRPVKAVRFVRGPEVWKAGWSQRLLAAALSRSDDLLGFTSDDGRTQDMLAGGEIERRATHPAACLVEHEGGLRSTLLLLAGAVAGTTFAVRAGKRVESGHLLVPALPSMSTLAPLAAAIEDFLDGKKPAVPPTRVVQAATILDVIPRDR